jgi:hypothetical protein
MPQTPHDLMADESINDAQRHAYNAAFDELGLNWHWDFATYAWVRAQGRDGLRSYLEREHAHLLRAYEPDFLMNAIEVAKARCQAAVAASRRGAATHAGRAASSFSSLAA